MLSTKQLRQNKKGILKRKLGLSAISQVSKCPSEVHPFFAPTWLMGRTQFPPPRETPLQSTHGLSRWLWELPYDKDDRMKLRPPLRCQNGTLWGYFKLLVDWCPGNLHIGYCSLVLVAAAPRELSHHRAIQPDSSPTSEQRGSKPCCVRHVCRSSKVFDSPSRKGPRCCNSGDEILGTRQV